MNKIFKLILLFSISYLFCFSIINVSAKPLDYFEDINYIDNFTEENIEDYDLYHLLSYDEANVLFKWLEDSYKLKLDKEKDYDFISDNLSKFVLLAMQRGIVKNYYSDSDFTVMWAGDEHFSITAQALNILINDEKISVHSIYNPYIAKLTEYSKKPDLDESIGGTHYYVYEGTPTTNGGYFKNRNGNYSRSARTRFENHYSSAINTYKNGQYEFAMEYLGRALHYIEDIGATPHSSGISDSFSLDNIINSINKPHHKYESWVNDNYDNYPEFMANSSSKYNYVLNTSFQTITYDLAQGASF